MTSLMPTAATGEMMRTDGFGYACAAESNKRTAKSHKVSHGNTRKGMEDFGQKSNELIGNGLSGPGLRLDSLSVCFRVIPWLEPISIIGTCATEAMWDAGRGEGPEATCRYCEGSRQRDAPLSGRLPTAGRTPARIGAQWRSHCSAPRPTRVAARARGRRSSACAYTRRCDPGAGHSAALERVLAHLRGRIPGRT